MKNKFFNIFIFIVFIASFTWKISNVMAVTYPFEGMIDADSLVIRSAASNSSTALTELAYGTRVTVSATSGNFYKITYEGNKTGYALSKYVINIKENTLTSNANGIETYDTYCAMLGNKGFPESFCPYLYYLHSKYPKWVFNVDKVGLTLDAAASGEEWRSSLQTSNKNYWLQTTPQESNYYYIKKSVIASYMDPRNSLFESRIFQFFDSDANKDLVSDETLNYMVGDGYLKQFLIYFKQGASSQGINVVQLVARSKQEGNNVAGYGPSSGNYTTNTYNGNSLKGYYNFYNINAVAPNTFVNALAYAASYFNTSNPANTTFQRPWKTPEAAIKGGAEFLASRYIKKGQDTIYYQKFNISSYRTNEIYSNQYMTNIYAPASESSSMFKTYKDSNTLNQAFVFTIPVFNNMGNVYQPVNKDSNSKLSSIKINDVALPGFDASVLEQPTYYLQTNSGTFNVVATAEAKTTSLSGTGTYTFSNGVANVAITATAEDGSKSVYTVKVIQAKIADGVKVSDVVSKMNVKIDNNIMYGISVGTTVQSLKNEALLSSGMAIVKDSSGKEKTSGNLVTGDIVTIKGSSESINYTIAIRGDINSDGIVDLKDFVLCQSHLLKKLELTGIKVYAANVNYDGTIDLKDFVLIQSHLLKKLTL